METITAFKASDGKIFFDKDKCLDYEEIIAAMARIESELPEAIDTTSFANGGGYIQHDPEKVKQAKENLLVYSNRRFKTNYGFDFIGRVMQDSGLIVMYNLWHRLSCVDKYGREWGQPYYAIHPKEGKQVQLNRTP